MNGYETMSENYKILMQRGEIEKEAAEKAIRVYDFLAGTDCKRGLRSSFSIAKAGS